MYPYIPYGWMPVRNQQGSSNNDNYLKSLFKKLAGKKVDILLNGRETVFKDLLVLGVKDNVVISEADDEICMIPIKWIATVFLSKDLAKEVIYS